MQENGKNLTGFQKIADQNKICYYNSSNCAMFYGHQKINGKEQYFDPVADIQAKNSYVWIGNQNKEVYYD